MGDTMSESMGALRLDSERLYCQCMASASHWPPACFWGHLIHRHCGMLPVTSPVHCKQTAMRLPGVMHWPAAQRVMLVGTCFATSGTAECMTRMRLRPHQHSCKQSQQISIIIRTPVAPWHALCLA